MNGCDEIRKLLPGWMYGTLPDHVAEEVAQHVDVCRDCAEFHSAQQDRFALLDRWADIEPPAALTQRVMARLRPAPVPVKREWRLPSRARVAAASVIAALGSMLWFGTALQADNQELLVYTRGAMEAGGQAAVRVVTRTHADRRPLAGARIAMALIDHEGVRHVLYEGRTSAAGTVDSAFEVPDVAGDCRLVITADSPSGHDQVDQAVRVERRVRSLLSSDKPVYQPGQTVHMRTLSMQVGRARMAAADTQVAFEVEDPRGNKVFKREGAVGPFGVASADFVLGREVSLGTYRLRARVGDEETERTVEIRKYALPKFKVSVTAGRTLYHPAETLTATVDSAYFFGKKVAGAQVSVDASTFDVAFKKFAHLEGRTDADGRWQFEVRVPPMVVGQPMARGQGVLRLEVAVVDSAGHEEKSSETVQVAEAAPAPGGQPVAGQAGYASTGQIPLTVDVIPERKNLLSGVPNVLFVMTTAPGGAPVSAAVTLTVNGEQMHGHSDDFGIADFTVTPTGTLTVEAVAAKGTDYSGRAKVVLEPGYDSDLRVRTDRALYSVGQTLRVTVLSASLQGSAFVDVLRDGQSIATRTVELDGGRGDTSLELGPDTMGTLQIVAWHDERGTTPRSDAQTVIVRDASALAVTTKLDREVCRPGEKARLRVDVRDDKGQPVAAALGLQVVDESVFALAEQHPGLDKVYFALEKSLLTPTVTVAGHNSTLDIMKLVTPSRQDDVESMQQRAARVLLAAGEKQPALSQARNSFWDKRARLQAKRDQASLGLALVGMVVVFGLLTWAAARRETMPRLAAGLVMLTVLVVLFEGPRVDIGPLIGVGVIYFVLWTAIATVAGRMLASRGAVSCAGFYVGVALCVALTTQLWGPYRAPEVLDRIVLGTTLPGLVCGLVLMIRALSIAISPEGTAEERADGMSLLNLLIACFVIFFAFAVMTPNFIRARAQGQGTACKSNLKNIGTALEMWSTDHGGKFPDSLEALVPKYLRAIPTCPSVGEATYLRGYDVWHNPERYVVMCRGANHTGLGYPPDFPRYSSEGGLEERNGNEHNIGTGLPDEAGTNSATPPSSHHDTAPRPDFGGLHVRQLFPETMYWNPLVLTGADGSAEVEIPCADSITDWRLSVMANGMSGQLGSHTGKLRVFQPFFLDPDLPAELTRGDRVTVPVAVYNYLATAQDLTVQLDPAPWFEVDGSLTRTVRLRPNDVTSIGFPLQVLTCGDFRLTLTGRGGAAKDAVSRPIRVVADGHETVDTQNGELHGTASHTVFIPHERVPGGSTIVLKIYPGTFTQVVDGLEGLLAAPYGCFEQTSSVTYPNVLILRYLKATGRISAELKTKAEELINTGYQRLLSYEVSGGGFDWFGHPPANRILTAYGLMEFHDMASVFPIDQDVISRTRDWLEKQQAADGSFATESHGLHASPSLDRMRSTAYITVALLEAGTRDEAVERAVGWLRAHIDDATDAYALALLANALVLHDRGHASTSEVISRLSRLAERSGKNLSWPVSTTVMYGGGEAARVETTAWAAMALMRAGGHGDQVTAALSYLIAARRGSGAWDSTQATVLALRALVEGASQQGGGQFSGTVTVKVNGREAGKVALTPETSDVLRMIDLRNFIHPGANRVDIEGAGAVAVPYQIVSKYALPWIAEKRVAASPLSIAVDYDRTTLMREDTLQATAVLHNGMAQAAPMVIADLGVPPGFTVLTGDLDALQRAGLIARYESGDRHIVVYLRGVAAGATVRVAYRLKARCPLRARTPASSVYEYYDSSVRGEAAPQTITVR